MLLIFLSISALISLTLCMSVGYTGIALIGFFLLFVLLALAAVCLVFALFLLLVSLWSDRHPGEPKHPFFYRFLLIYTLGTVLQFGRVRLRVTGIKQLPDGAFFFAGNHRSAFDPLIAIWALRRYDLNFISKPSNFKIPIAGPFMRKCGFLAIDREDDRAALRTILDAAACMKDGKACFGVYPEGTRSHGSEMLPFRNGCFKAAQRAKVPVVVAAIQNSELIAKNFPWRSTYVHLHICGVIPAEEAAAMKTAELGDKVRDMLEEALRSAD